MTLLAIDFQMFLTWYREDRRVACAHEAGLDHALARIQGVSRKDGQGRA
jgi:hypothetical protein